MIDTVNMEATKDAVRKALEKENITAITFAVTYRTENGFGVRAETGGFLNDQALCALRILKQTSSSL